jgi:hypothetical protein
MRRIGILTAALAVLATVAPLARAADDPEAIAARMPTHHANAGLRDLSKPIVSANGVTCTAGGSLGRIQAFFLELADTERNLEVTSVEIRRAAETMMAKNVVLEVEYTVVYVPTPDDRLAKAQWAVPVLVKALVGATVASQGFSLMSAKIEKGAMTVDGRGSSGDASKAVVKLLDPGPGHFVTSATADQKRLREMVRDGDGSMPQRAVTSFAFRIAAAYDTANVRLDVLKRLAYE